MTPEQEIQRIEYDYKDHWQRLEKHPDIITALKDNDPIRLGEVVALLVYGENDPSNGLKYQIYRHQVLVNINNEAMVYVNFKSGNHVNLTTFVYPNDVNICEGWAKQIGAEHGMNPAKTVFFFRHLH